MACAEGGVRCHAPAGARVAQPRLQRAARSAAPRVGRRPALRVCAAAGGLKEKPAPVTSDDDLYTYTPKGKRVKKPTNAFERALFDYYFKPQELSEWEKKLKAFTEENFRGLREWSTIFLELKAAKVRSCSVESAYSAVGPRETRRAPGPLDALLGGPPVLLDVREEAAFSRARPDGADNVPLYKQLLQPRTPFDWARVVAFGLLALRPPVRNEDFIADVERLVAGKKNTPIYVICNSGGTLETAEERKIRAPRIPAPIFGKYGAASRSLLAIHELVIKGGFTNVVHVEGGYSSWTARKLPGEWDE